MPSPPEPPGAAPPAPQPETLDLRAPGAAHAPAGGGPGDRFDRFLLLECLGRGGMGEVWRADDTRLHRTVALKILSDAASDAAGTRLLREAQAQARVRHPNVLPVFEVGAAEGRPFIVMQLAEGGTLRQATAGLPLRRRLELFLPICEAVEAAHRAGLIHRDLKPSNLLVDRSPEGALVPYVADFGIAIELGAAGATAPGVVLGTPAYLAPERLRPGAPSDPRSDVYSLGATLYEMLSGEPPYGTASSYAVLAELIAGAPRPLRDAAPEVPRDLATLVDTCLARDPERRYASAGELAADLARFLDHRPILARRPSLVHRARLRLRRHRGAARAAALGVALLLAALVVTVTREARGRERFALARRYGAIAGEIESRLREASLRPRHDLRPELAAARAEIAALERRIATDGEPAGGPGREALGRARLALGDLEAARRDLEAARAGGFVDPASAAALGQVYAGLYEREARALERLSDPELVAERRRALAATLRDPALALLREAPVAAAGRGLPLAARVAFLEERDEDALAGARRALTADPFAFEALRLEGQVRAGRATARRRAGDFEAARVELDRAEAAFARASEIARSDPESLIGLCALGFARLTLVAFGAADDTAGAGERALAACDAALELDPERAETWWQKSTVAWRLGELALAESAAAARPHLTLAVTAAARAAALAPADPYPLQALGNAQSLEAETVPEPESALALSERALDTLRAASGLAAGDFTIWNDLGFTAADVYRRRLALGHDGGEAFAGARAALERAIELAPRYPTARTNLGRLHLGRARELAASDPAAARRHLDEALAELERSLALNPRYAFTLTTLEEARRLAGLAGPGPSR